METGTMDQLYTTVCNKAVKILIAKEFVSKAAVFADIMGVTADVLKNLMAGRKTWDQERFKQFSRACKKIDYDTWDWVKEEILPEGF